MLNKLVFANFESSDLPPELWTRAEAISSELVRVSRDSSDFEESIRDADGLILRLGMAADEQLFDSAPKLKYVGMFGTGYGRIDTVAAKARGIVVSNVADYSTESVAELVVACSLIALRNLHAEHDRAMGGDVEETSFEGRDLSAKSVGIVGAGHIGRRVIAILSQGFKSKVSYWSRSEHPELSGLSDVNSVSFEEVLSSSDLISLHLAANAETAQILGAKQIGQIQRGAILINTSPNELVDLDAVISRASAGDLHYVMDHADEIEDASLRSRLIATPNVTVYPPIGYATVEATDAKLDILISNIEHFVDGSPTNHVNP